MAGSNEEKIDLAGLISDDSRFDGDEEMKARLEAKAADFDPTPYWEYYEYLLISSQLLGEESQRDCPRGTLSLSAIKKTLFSYADGEKSLSNPTTGQVVR